ncbi:MAG: cysteine dioxygenase family protein [Flavobacteriales bacterium]
MALMFEPALMSETIDSLAELVRVLDRESHPAGFTDALLRASIPPKELASFSLWNSRHYSRQCVHRTRDYELMLICYEQGQSTSIHDYDSQMAWIKPVQGTVQEERFKATTDDKLKLHGEKILGVGSLSYMAAKICIHRHSNAGTGRAITLNLYSKPIRRWRVYDERTGLASLSGTGDADGG